MYLADYAKHANTAGRVRRAIRLQGVTCRGYPLWTAEEDETCRDLYPDYDAMCAELSRRTRRAIEFRCGVLGIRSTLKTWTGADVGRLRKLYPASPWSVLLAAFPGRSQKAIGQAAQRLRLVRERRRYVPTGNKLLDELRDECFRQGLNMADLDEIARGAGYFRRREWHGERGRLDERKILRAIRELGGEVNIRWGDQ